MPDRKEAIKLIRQAYELSCTFFDTAEGYGMGANAEVLAADYDVIMLDLRGHGKSDEPDDEYD